MNHILTNDSLTILRDGRPATLHRNEAGEEAFHDAIQAVTDGNYEAVLRYLDRSTQVHQYFEGKGIEVHGGVLYYGDQPLDNYPARKPVEFWQQGLPHEALINFLGDLLQNPSFRAVQDLYSFLEYNNMPLTDDGSFVAYKAVTRHVSGKFVDTYSQSIRNNPGDTIEMPRNQVDEDPYRTCSKGLHVCGYDYLPFFGAGSQQAVVAVKVRPQDVVAVPIDYNNAKMRVARYQVLYELPDWRDQGHIWADVAVVLHDDESKDNDPRFLTRLAES